MENLAIYVALFLFLGLGLCCLLAHIAQPVREMVRSVFMIFYQPLNQILQTTSTYGGALRRWLLRQIEDESDRQGEGPLYYIIGSVLYTVLTLLFILCDFGMIALTVEAMGMDEPSVSLPIDTSTLTAATLVTTALFWGAILFDLLGVTRLAAWRKSLSERNRKLFVAISVLFVTLSVCIGVATAYWRGESLNQWIPEAEASPVDAAYLDVGVLTLPDEPGATQMEKDGGDPLLNEDFEPNGSSPDWIVQSTLMGIAGLSLASTAFSMVGLGVMVKFLILLLICVSSLGLLPVIFLAWLSSFLVSIICNAVERVLDVLIQIGTSFLGLFGYQRGDTDVETQGNSSVEPPMDNPPRVPVSDSANAVPAVDPGFNPFRGGLV